VIILTLFGTTTGLELINFPLTDNLPPLKFEDAWIGVTPSQVTLIPEKDACVIFRRTVGTHLVTWVGIYRPAREIGYDRPGSFYGAGAWIIDGVADAKLLAALLREMANQIQAVAMQGDQFIKKLANAKSQFTPPSLVPAIVASLEKINSGVKPDGESAFIVESVNPVDVIDWAQRASSAGLFSKILIGTAGQVPSSGQSSIFRTFPSLSLAIDATYLRLKSDSQNRIMELTQNIATLQATNSEKDERLKSVSYKLLKVEAASNALYEKSKGYLEEIQYLKSLSKTPARMTSPDAGTGSWHISVADSYPSLTYPPPATFGAGQVNSSMRSASGDSPRGNVIPPQTVRQQTVRQQPEEEDPPSKDWWSFVIYVILILVGLALVVALVLGFTISKRTDCTFFGFDCVPKPEPHRSFDPSGESSSESSTANGSTNWRR